METTPEKVRKHFLKSEKSEITGNPVLKKTGVGLKLQFSFPIHNSTLLRVSGKT
jgi:hypothetical protein